MPRSLVVLSANATLEVLGLILKFSKVLLGFTMKFSVAARSQDLCWNKWFAFDYIHEKTWEYSTIFGSVSDKGYIIKHKRCFPSRWPVAWNRKNAYRLPCDILSQIESNLEIPLFCLNKRLTNTLRKCKLAFIHVHKQFKGIPGFWGEGAIVTFAK